MKKILFCLMCFALTACDNNTEKQLKSLSEKAVILAFSDSLTYGVGTKNQLPRCFGNTQSA